jgi:hypothetical protein
LLLGLDAKHKPGGWLCINGIFGGNRLDEQ